MKNQLKTPTLALIGFTTCFSLTFMSSTIEGTQKEIVPSVVSTQSSSTKSGTLLTNKTQKQWIKRLKKCPTFDSNKEQDYLDIIEQFPFANETFVLSLEAHPEIYNDFYQDIQLIQDPSELLVLVNKNYQLSPDYVPNDLVLPQVQMITASENNYLRQEAATALEEMFQAASTDDIELYARSGYRSYQTQTYLYENYVASSGQEQADTYSARPGHSEHQTGLAVDVTSTSVGFQLDDQFDLSPEGEWITHHAHEYGFIIRFQKGKETLTGFQYEPWHLRYVGKEVAQEITENNWLLEDYLLMNGKFLHEQ